MRRMRYLSQIVDRPDQTQLNFGKEAKFAKIWIQNFQRNRKLLGMFQSIPAYELALIERDTFPNFQPRLLPGHKLDAF